MNNKLKVLVSVIVMSFVMMGCGGGDDESKANAPIQDGLWQSDKNRDGHYYYFEIFNNGTKMTHVSHQGCSIYIEEIKDAIEDEWIIFNNMTGNTCNIPYELHFKFSTSEGNQMNEVGPWGDNYIGMNPPGKHNNR